MLKFFVNLSVYSVWFAIAAMFGIERYSTVGCQITERYDRHRSHNWSRIVALVMMTVVEAMYWQPLSQLWARWKMEEEAPFFTFIFLAAYAYCLHRIFCLLVEHFENLGYTRAEDDAEAYSEHCSNCCFRASGRVTDLECPVMGVTECPCLEDGHDVRDVNYLSEVITALRQASDYYHRRGQRVPSPVSIHVPAHRVVVKKNPFDELFKDRWEFDIDLGSIDLTTNEKRPQSAKIIDFPVAAAAIPASSSAPSMERHRVAGAFLKRGAYGEYSLHMTPDGVVCHLARKMPDGNKFDQKFMLVGVEDCLTIDEVMTSEPGKLLYRLVNTPTFDEEQLSALC